MTSEHRALQLCANEREHLSMCFQILTVCDVTRHHLDWPCKTPGWVENKLHQKHMTCTPMTCHTHHVSCTHIVNAHSCTFTFMICCCCFNKNVAIIHLSADVMTIQQPMRAKMLCTVHVRVSVCSSCLCPCFEHVRVSMWLFFLHLDHANNPQVCMVSGATTRL